MTTEPSRRPGILRCIRFGAIAVLAMPVASIDAQPARGGATGLLRVADSAQTAGSGAASGATSGGGICSRTQQVREAILARIDGVTDCADVTNTQLAGITGTLDLSSTAIQSLRAGDFAGLSAVRLLDLHDNALTSLPSGLLSGLSSLEVLYLDNNALTALPSDLLTPVRRLRELWARNNALTAFPRGFFDGESELTELQIYHNPGDPELKALDPVDYHTGSPLGIYVYLESLGQGQFRILVPVGTAFETVVSLGVTNGTIANDRITIPAGRLHSAVFAVTREAGTSATVTVDIVDVQASNPDPRPWPWPKVTPMLHNGVVIAKAGVLPVEVLPSRKPRVRIAPRDAADSVPEGAAAAFTLSRDLPHDDALTVSVDVGQTGEVIRIADGYEAPSSAVFPANEGTATLTVETQADSVDEENGTITAAVTAAESDAYAAGEPAAAEVTVTDDDETRATVSAVSISSDPGTDGAYAIGDKVKATVAFSVGFSGPLTVSGRPQLDLAVGAATRAATYESGSGTTRLVFAYTIAASDEDTDGIAIGADALRLNGGVINTSRLNAYLAHAALAADPVHKVDGVRPALTGAATSVDGRSVVLTYAEALDAAHPPPQSAFAVTVNGQDAALGGAPMVSGAEVTLPLASPLRYGVTVAASYTAPGAADDADAVQDLHGNDAASATVAVTNNVPDTGNPYVDLILDPASITENGGVSTVTASLSRPARAAFTVTVTATALSPALAEDFTLSGNATLSFAAGATASTGTVEITAVDNDLESDDKRVRVSATAAAGSGVEPPPSRTLTIRDDEVAFVDVCDRTAQVRDGLVRRNHSGACERVTQGNLERILQFDLSGKGITSLQSGDFSGLTGLQSLLLSNNQLTTLPSDIFYGLPRLRTIRLVGNPSLTLPRGVFSGLTGLTQLAMHHQELPIALEKVATGRFRATIATGAPFDLPIQVAVTNGALPEGVSSITIPAGSMQSNTIVVTRTGPEAVAADITGLPGLRVGHLYYSFVKAYGLPLELIEAVPVVTIAAGASSVTEGDPATFTLTRTGGNGSALTVPVTVSETGSVIRTDNAYAAPHEAVFASNSPTATLTVQTQADALDEEAGSITVALTAGSNSSYVVGSASTATLAVTDDDEKPGAPTGLAATAGDAEVTLAWTAPDNTGTSAIDGYQYRRKAGSGSYGDWADIADSAPGETNATSYTVTGLTNGTAYAFEVRAVSAAGEGPESAEATATPVAEDVDDQAPQLLAGAPGAQVDWDRLTLTYDEALDESSAPAAGAFALAVAGQSRGVSGVGVSGTTVVLTLASAVAAGETVQVSYTVPTGNGAQPVRDEALNSAADLTNRSVRNGTPGVTLVLSPANIPEGGSSNRSTVTATVSPAAPAAFTVAVSASPVQPAATGDYALSASPELSFAKGDTASGGTVTITAVDNAVDAEDKAVAVSGTLSSGAKVTAPQDVTLTITDDDEKPGAPTGLAATAGDAEVTLAWTAPDNTGTSAITGYQYRRKEGHGSYGDWADIADSAPGETNATSYTVTGLTNGTSYGFQVRALAGTFKGAESEELTAMPLAPPLPATDFQTFRRTKMVLLVWKLPEQPAGVTVSGVELQQQQADSSWNTVATIGRTTKGRFKTSHSVWGLADGASYTFRVRLLTNNGHVDSEPVTETTLTAASPAADLAASNATATTVDLSWTLPGQPSDVRVVRVEVQQQQADSSWNTLATLAADATSHTVTGLSAGQSYSFRVRLGTTSFNADSQSVDVNTPGQRADPDGTRDGATALDVAAALQEPWYLHGQSLDRAGGDAVDYYRFTLTERKELGLGVRGQSIDLDAYLEDASGNRLEASWPPSGSPTFEWLKTELDAGTYYVRVEAMEDGATDYYVRFGLKAPSAPPPSLPSANAATDLSASNATQTTIDLNWTLPAQPAGVTVNGVEVQRQSNGSWSTVARLAADATAHALTGLTADTAYTLRVRLETSGGPADSDSVEASTLAPPDPDGTRDGATALDVAAAVIEPWYLNGQSLDRAGGDAVDYYRFTLTERKELGLGVRGQSIDLDVFLEDASGKRLEASWPPPGNPSIEWLKIELDAGTYYVRVEAMEDGATDYYVRFGLKAPQPAISVSGARADEGPNVSMGFEVSLDRSASASVTVEYATSDGTAVAGEDYTASSGTLTFSSGEIRKTVSVAILDDAHDEGEETFSLTLSNASGARIVTARATGTIVNADPMPRAWLARFGRTASVHVVDAIGERLRNDTPETHFTVGGWRLGSLFGTERHEAGFDGPLGSQLASGPRLPGADGRLPGADASGFGASAEGDPGDPGRSNASASWGNASESWVLADGGPGDHSGPASSGGLPHWRDVLRGSSFFYANPVEPDDGPGLGHWSVWGSTAATRFSGADGLWSLDGEVDTALLGVDSRWGRWLAGVTLSHSVGEGGYTSRQAAGGGVGSTLTSLNPYVQYRFSERTSLWGVAGYGVGGLTLTLEGAEAALETDLATTMAAFGGRGVLSVRAASAGVFELAVVSDALVTETVSEEVPGLMGATAATSRLRMMLEGSLALPLKSGEVRSGIEAGLRYDGGDAETGAGFEVGGSLAYVAERLAVEVKARTLLAHADTDYRERGLSASVQFRPGDSGRGLSMNLGSSWGAAQSGLHTLWSAHQAHGLASNHGFALQSHVQAELGYGLPVGRGRFLGTPYVGLGRNGSGRDLRLGLRLGAMQREVLDLEVHLEAMQRDTDGGNQQPSERGVLLQGVLRW